MLVKDKMTPNPICGRPEMSVMDAQKIMRENNIRHLPIVDQDERLVGIVTQRALMQVVPADMSKFGPFVINYIVAKLKAQNVMVKNVITIQEDVTIEEAARIMSDKKIGCLPVMRQGDLVGIISDNDLFRTMVDLLGAQRSGVRVTVLLPDRVGQVACLTHAIAQQGGNLSVFVTYPTADPNIWALVFRVTNMTEEKLVETLAELTDIRIQDVRKVTVEA